MNDVLDKYKIIVHNELKEDKNIGSHFIVDIYDIRDDIFINKLSKKSYDIFNKYIEDSLLRNNMNLLSKQIYHFDDNGAFTALYLLSESHLSLHTWPENNYIALDVFTCGICDTKKLVFDIIDFIGQCNYKITKVNRGNNFSLS
jgi:S-adenosylmethionine decarboxylase proenzyme